MIKILFRGKRIDNGEWVKGFYLELPGVGAVILNDNGYAKVIPESVGQYTGVIDKNREKIFEGDIIKDKYGRIMIVVWREKFVKFAFKLIKATGKSWTKNFIYADMGDWFDLENNLPEVIGNIHDNPELLEVKNDTL